MTTRLWYFIYIILFAIASYRIILSYPYMTVSEDEIQHIATGIEWLENSTYQLEDLHPPLARIVAAFLLYLDGVRLGQEYYDQYITNNHRENKDYYLKSYQGRINGGYQAIFSTGVDTANYDRRIFLVRISILPFFILGGIALVLLSHRLFGISTAVYALLFYTTLPIILASCVILNTDMAGMAFFIISIYYAMLWLEAPTFMRSTMLGVTLGLASLSKFSSILFFLACASITLIVRDYYSKKIVARGFNSIWVKYCSITIFCSLVVIWFGYKWSVATFAELYPAINQYILLLKEKNEKWANILCTLSEIKIIPFPEFFIGIYELILRNNIAYAGYILGEPLLHKGAWYFFPVATLVKNPIPFLLFSALGIYHVLRRNKKRWQVVLPITSTCAIFLVAAFFNINIGLRHILPVFPLLCILAAYSICSILHNTEQSRKVLIQKSITTLLLAVYIINSSKSHPNYISYFNILAGANPENILIEGDFDIGQDLRLLAQYLYDHNLQDKTKVYSFNGVNPEFWGIKNYVIFMNKMRFQDFTVSFDDAEYIAISTAITKFRNLFSKGALSALYCSSTPIRVGTTFLLYRKNNKCLH